MNADSSMPLSDHPPRRVLLAGAVWFGVYVAARFAVQESGLPDVARLAAAYIPLLAFFWFVWVVRRALGSVDELHRLIQLDALAMAFPTTMMVFMTTGLMELFHEGRLSLPLRDLWGILPVIYAICLAIAWRRYR